MPTTTTTTANDLPPGQQLAAANRWPLVGERSAAAWSGADGSWPVEIVGLIERPQTWTVEALRAMPRMESVVDVHCVTRWSKPGMRFGGVLLADLLALAVSDATARYVSFVARSTRGHSTSLALADAISLGTMIAIDADGAPLAAEHGGPVRVITPGRYFYKSLKWLRRIELLAEDRLGYWEAEAGYHNNADPWREQRFIAPQLTWQQMRDVLERRDFAGRDLRGIDAAGHDLERLDARGALLRNADFRRARLAGANFAGANLSNAHFADADLSDASFAGADLEGADFSGAHLRGADFRGASLFGATFFDGEYPDGATAAAIDATTQFDADRLDELTPPQVAFVRRAIEQGPR